MKPETIRDFQAAKFGMFLHRGLYAVPGGRWNGEPMDYIGEWGPSKFRIPSAEYARLAREFNPIHFDAEAWVKKAAAETELGELTVSGGESGMFPLRTTGVEAPGGGMDEFRRVEALSPMIGYRKGNLCE